MPFDFVIGDPNAFDVAGDAREAALCRWVVMATGIPAERVIRANQDGPRPAAPFAEIGMGPLTPLGAVDQYDAVYDPAGNPGEEIVETVRGQREARVIVRVFTDRAVGVDCARDLASRCQLALALPSVRDVFYAAGMTAYDNGRIDHIPSVLDTRWEGRARLEIGVYLEDSAASRTGYIDQVRVTDESEDPIPPFIVDAS